MVWRGDVWGHGKARSHRRRSDQRQQRWGLWYQPSDAFRTPDPSIRPQGDPFAGSVTSSVDDPATPSVSTYKFSAAFHATDDLMVYLTYAEGFTSASRPLVRIGPTAVLPHDCVPAPIAEQALCDLPPEVVDNTEIGIRSDWLDGRLRFNATYFDSNWNGMRVPVAPAECTRREGPVLLHLGRRCGNRARLGARDGLGGDR